MNLLKNIRRRIAYALAPELLAARTLAEFAHDVVQNGLARNTLEIQARDRGIQRLTRKLAVARRKLGEVNAIVKTATDLFDNRMGYMQHPGPWAHFDFWIDLGTAIYGAEDERVLAMIEARASVEGKLWPPAVTEIEIEIERNAAPRAPDPFDHSPVALGEPYQIVSVEEDVPRPVRAPSEWPPRIEISGGPSPAQVSDGDEIDENVPF